MIECCGWIQSAPSVDGVNDYVNDGVNDYDAWKIPLSILLPT